MDTKTGNIFMQSDQIKYAGGGGVRRCASFTGMP
jgi:hypothetical protein